MAIHEVVFPEGISYGSSGGPGFSTAIIETDSGAEERVARWTGARRKYNIAEGIKSYADLAELQEFYIARLGAAYGFLYKDFLDCVSSVNGLASSFADSIAATKDDQQIGIGDASETQFQLVKKYTSIVTRTRNITKPKVGTVLIALDGVNQTTGWSVSPTTGLVTFTSAPSGGVVITAGFEFYVPVRFSDVTDQVLNMSIDNYGSGSAANINVVEIRDEGEVDGEFFYGGAIELPMIADTTLTIGDGRVVRCYPTSIFQLFLPDITNLGSGGPYFYIFNDGSASVTIRDFGDSHSVATLGAGNQITLCLSELSGTKTWRVF